MSQRSRRRSPKFFIETKWAEPKMVELEIKEIVEKDNVDSDRVTFHLVFTNNTRFDVTVIKGSYDYNHRWKKLQEGKKVIASTRAQRIDKICKFCN